MAAKRYFELSDGTSNKFWEVWREGVQVFTRYGKIGANGQVTVKKLASDGAARAQHDLLVLQKQKKGYAEAGGQKPKAASKSKAVPAAPGVEVIVVPKGGYRLEVVEGKSSKFWEISRNEKTVIVTFGKIGTAGTTTKTKHKEEWAARYDIDRQIAEKTKKGYRFVEAGPRRPPPPPGAINAQLEQAIAKDPSSDDGYMVYADWLMQQNDLRGELASIQARLAGKKDKKLSNAETKLLFDNRDYFYGPWAIHITAGKKAEKEPITATWRQGWMDSLRLSAVSIYSREDGEASPRPPVRECADLVHGLPNVSSARLVRTLTIGSPAANDEFRFQSTMKELAKALPGLPALRTLTIGDFEMEDSELSWSHLGPMKDVWPALGKLEHLTIHAGSMDLGTIRAPELRTLRIETGGLTKKNLASIIDADLPKLESLTLWFGQDNYGCNIEPKDVTPLLAGKKFPKLRHLGLANSTWGNDLLPLIASSKILPKLESLDLSMSHTTRAGIEELMKSAAAFKHLTALDLSQCLLDTHARRLAKTLCKNVDVSSQEDEDDHRPEEGEEDEDWWRYSAVGE